MSVSVLDREMFTEAKAARLLRVPQRTLNYRLEGGEVRGRVYRPVIRTEPRGGHAAVTWAEFVEARLLQFTQMEVTMCQWRHISTYWTRKARSSTR